MRLRCCGRLMCVLCCRGAGGVARYEGDWFNDQMNGKGVYVSAVLWDHQFRYVPFPVTSPQRTVMFHLPGEVCPLL